MHAIIFIHLHMHTCIHTIHTYMMEECESWYAVMEYIVCLYIYEFDLKEDLFDVCVRTYVYVNS